MKKIKYILLYSAIGVITLSCDATYSVSIINKSEATVSIDAKLTNNFIPGDITTTFIPDENNRVQFNIEAHQGFVCGLAIAELKDDLPFTEIIIYTKNDTIRANNSTEVMALFDTNRMGILKKPYTLSVE